MQIDYIRRDTPEEISENGGAYIQLVNKDTIGLKSSIAEAKSSLYVVGQDSMIEGYFVGLMRSVFEGIKEDGHPRTVGDVTIFPVCGGTFDLDKGWDPLVNDVRIKARLLNGLTLDITDWTFRDVTEGRVVYSIDTVSDGTTAGIVSTDENVELNGRNFPAKDLLTVSWVCGTKSGTVDAAKFTANVARITIDKSAFAPTLSSSDRSLRCAHSLSDSVGLDPSDTGKEIVFTVKGCYNKATKSAVVKYVAPAPKLTRVYGTEEGGAVGGGGSMTIEGSNLQITSDNSEGVFFSWTEGGVARSEVRQYGELTVNEDATVCTVTMIPISAQNVDGNKFSITFKGRAGIAGGELKEVTYKDIPYKYV